MSLEFEPLEEGYVLNVVGGSKEASGRVGDVGGKTLNHVAHFHEVLTLVTGQPPRGDVVNVVEPREGIVEGLCHLVAEAGDVLNVFGEQPRADIAGENHHVEPGEIVVIWNSRLFIEGMETEDATIAGTAFIEKGVRKEKRGDGLGSHDAGKFRCTDEGVLSTG